jgi:hypothetical protein
MGAEARGGTQSRLPQRRWSERRCWLQSLPEAAQSQRTPGSETPTPERGSIEHLVMHVRELSRREIRSVSLALETSITCNDALQREEPGNIWATHPTEPRRRAIGRILLATRFTLTRRTRTNSGPELRNRRSQVRIPTGALRSLGERITDRAPTRVPARREATRSRPDAGPDPPTRRRTRHAR